MAHDFSALVALPLIVKLKPELLKEALYCVALGPAPFDSDDDTAEEAFDKQYPIYLDDHDFVRNWDAERGEMSISPSEGSWNSGGAQDLDKVRRFIQTFAADTALPLVLQTTYVGSSTYSNYPDRAWVELVFLFDDDHYVLNHGTTRRDNVVDTGKHSGFADLLIQNRDLLGRLAMHGDFQKVQK